MLTMYFAADLLEELDGININGSTLFPEIEFNREEKLSARLPLAIGTSIIAVRDFGPVREGAPGIIIGIVEVPFFLVVAADVPVHVCGQPKSRRTPEGDQ